MLVACERTNAWNEHIFVLARGERSKCARGVRTQQFFDGTFLFAHGMRSKCASACERISFFARTYLFAHGERSKCVHSVRMQQCCRMDMFVCARKEIQVCSRRENASTLLPKHVFSARGKRSNCACGVRAQPSCRMNKSLCLVCRWRSKWRGFRVCSRSSWPDVLLNMSPRELLCSGDSTCARVAVRRT